MKKKIAVNFPNLGDGSDIQGGKTQRLPNGMSPKRFTSTHISKVAKVKDKKRILKAAIEKSLATYKGSPIRLSADISAEALQVGRN